MNSRIAIGIAAGLIFVSGTAFFAFSAEDPAASPPTSASTTDAPTFTTRPPLATAPETTVIETTIPGETTTTHGYAILLPVTKFAPIPRYHNCDEVKAAGKAPLYSNQPGYRSSLDPDHDGIACDR